MPNFNQFVKTARSNLGRLQQPGPQYEAQQQDMNPENFRLIDRELGRAQNPMQRRVLTEERQRLENMHMQQLQQTAQQFVPRLQQELDPFVKTGIPPEPPMEVKLLLRQMLNGNQVQNPNPGGMLLNHLPRGYRG